MSVKWTQTLSEVTVEILLPAPLRAKDLKVTVKNGRFGVETGGEPLVAGELDNPVLEDETFWIVEDNHLEVSLTKKGRAWWSRLFKGDASIDIGGIEPEPMAFSELDEEEQMAVKKMAVSTFNE